ncbi:MAG: type IV secretion system protein [Alphaproteobacteria bacterium]
MIKFKTTIIIIIFLLLAACDGDGCIEPIKDISKKENNFKQAEVTVRADGNYSGNYDNSSNSFSTNINDYGQWLNTNVSVVKGDKIDIATSGTIFICMNPLTISNNSAGNDPLYIYKVNANHYNWTTKTINNDEIKVYAGDRYTTTIGSPNANNSPDGNKWSTWNSTKEYMPLPPAWDNNSTNNQICSSESEVLSPTHNCWYINGQFLRGRILDSTAKNDPNNSSYSDAYVTDLSKAFKIENATEASEMYKTINNTGILGFRVLDGDPEQYSDNVGGYTVNVRLYQCPAENGNKSSQFPVGNLMAVISSDDPKNSSETSNISNINGNNIANANGTIWLKVYDTNYTDNIQSYQVKLGITSDLSNGIYSNIVSKMIYFIESKINVAAISTFKNITCSNNTDKANCTNYIKIIRLMLTLYIIIYAIFFTFGLIQVSQLDLVMRIIKIAVILAFISDGSWKFFYDNFFRLFGIIDTALDKEENFTGTGTVYYLIGIMTGGNGSSQNPFAFVDYAMNAMFFNQNAAYRITSLLFTSIVGIFYFIGVVYAIFTFFKAVIEITINYLLSFTYVAVLIILAPIFIPCILFSMTKGIFDNWIKYAIRYTIEPIFLIVGLNIFVNLMQQCIYEIFNSPICWKCAVNLKIDFLTSWLGFSLPPEISNIFCINWFLPWGYDNSGGGITSSSIFIQKMPFIIFLIIITRMVGKYNDFINLLLSQITNTQQQYFISRQSGGSDTPAGEIMGSAAERVKSIVGLDNGTRERRATRQRIQKEADTLIEKKKAPKK